MFGNFAAAVPRRKLMGTMTDDLETRFAIACAVAREAGTLARRRFLERPRSQRPDMKGHQDYLTATDSEVEDLIRSRLAHLLPGDSFFGEEGGGSFDHDVWVVGPHRRHGEFRPRHPAFRHFHRLRRDNRTEIGVVYNVMQHELYAALRGHGATLNGETDPGQRLGRNQPRDGGGRMVVTLAVGALYRRLSRAEERRRQCPPRGLGTLGLAYVADGRTDAYCEFHINSWDVLAALLLVEEAGGWTNNFLAKDGLRKRQSCSRLHARTG